MRHVVVPDINKFRLQDAPDPTIQVPTDAIVKVTATTICGSDVHLIHSDLETPWGFPLGHEFVGSIHGLGTDVKSVKKGDRVVASPGVWCGRCDKCLSSQTNPANISEYTATEKSWGISEEPRLSPSTNALLRH